MRIRSLSLLCALLLASWAGAAQVGGPRGPSELPGLPPSAVVPAVRFTWEFQESVSALAREKGAARWSGRDWERLQLELRQFSAGAPSAARPARRGAAAEAGVWKFRFRGYRVFFHPTETGQVVLLDVKRKRELLAYGEDDFYDALAKRIKRLETRLIGGLDADRLGKLLDGSQR